MVPVPFPSLAVLSWAAVGPGTAELSSWPWETLWELLALSVRLEVWLWTALNWKTYAGNFNSQYSKRVQGDGFKQSEKIRRRYSP